MAKFTIVATAVETQKGWGISYEMADGDLTATETVLVGCKDMCHARVNIFNRVKQPGKAGLHVIGQQTIRNKFVKLA